MQKCQALLQDGLLLTGMPKLCAMARGCWARHSLHVRSRRHSSADLGVGKQEAPPKEQPSLQGGRKNSLGTEAGRKQAYRPIIPWSLLGNEQKTFQSSHYRKPFLKSWTKMSRFWNDLDFRCGDKGQSACI